MDSRAVGKGTDPLWQGDPGTEKSSSSGKEKYKIRDSSTSVQP